MWGLHWPVGSDPDLSPISIDFCCTGRFNIKGCSEPQQAPPPLPRRCCVWVQALCLSLSTSTLSSCSHAVVALLYPFSWQHTFIPVLPASMIDIVCCPTPFLVGLLSSSLPKLKELPVEEVGHLGNQLGGRLEGGRDRRNRNPQERRAEGEWRGERHGHSLFCDLWASLPSSSFLPGRAVPGWSYSCDLILGSRGLEAWGGHCRDSYPESLSPMPLFLRH